MNPILIKTAMWVFLVTAIWVLPFVVVVRTGKFAWGVALYWCMGILAFAVAALLVDLLVLPVNPNLARELPEANAAALFVAVGWLPGIIVSALALGMRRVIEKIKREHPRRG